VFTGKGKIKSSNENGSAMTSTEIREPIQVIEEIPPKNQHGEDGFPVSSISVTETPGVSVTKH
jgi:hypothetical protein